ncbi:hypothetical protein GCM10007937_20920 [Mesorhizobium albiziae]|nr:hypothetical protein GCM10007937_20920 [Mesorhizobium albiziae]
MTHSARLRSTSKARLEDRFDIADKDKLAIDTTFLPSVQKFGDAFSHTDEAREDRFEELSAAGE